MLIRRHNYMLTLSATDGGPVPEHLRETLQQTLSYWHKRHVPPAERYGPDGSYQAMEMQRREMYTWHAGGLLTAAAGHYERIVAALTQAGEPVQYTDCSPPKLEGTYECDWGRISRYEPRAGQLECLQAMAAREFGVVEAAAGFGKTFLFPVFAHLFPRAKVDIVARSKDVVSMIHKRMCEHHPHVGLHGGGKHIQGERINVLTADSLQRATGEADILLADEVHQLVAPKYVAGLTRGYSVARRFGLTATPKGRGDGATEQLEAFFGPKCFSLPYTAARELGLVVDVRVRWLPVFDPCPRAENLRDTALLRWGIWRNQACNQRIADDIRRQDPARQVLVLTSHVEHALYLWRLLPDFHLVYGSGSNTHLAQLIKHKGLPPGFRLLTDKQRNELRDRFAAGVVRRVIATDVWATGVDFPGLDLLYRTDCRSSRILDEQGTMRPSRVSPGKEGAEVVDVCHVYNGRLLERDKRRRTHYNQIGMTQLDWPRLTG